MWLALICSSITRLTRNRVNPELLYEGGSLFCTKAETPNVVFIYRLLCLNLQHYILNLIITKDNFPKKAKLVLGGFEGDVISLLFYNGGSSSWLVQVVQVKQLAVSIFLSCDLRKFEIVIILFHSMTFWRKFVGYFEFGGLECAWPTRAGDTTLRWEILCERGLLLTELLALVLLQDGLLERSFLSPSKERAWQDCPNWSSSLQGSATRVWSAFRLILREFS